MAVYMLLESVGRSPNRWEAPEDCALVGTLYMWGYVRSAGKERMSKETCRKKSGKKRGLLKRAPESYTRRVGKSRSIEKCREVSTVLVPLV
jgi:hypothetical protein